MDGWFGLVLWGVFLRPQIPKHIRRGWSHHTATSEQVVRNGANIQITWSLTNP
jgi:hypothetical protein